MGKKKNVLGYHFPRSSVIKYGMYDDRGKLILYSSDDRGKFKSKNLFGNPFYLFPGFQAFSGIFKTTHTKST